MCCGVGVGGGDVVAAGVADVAAAGATAAVEYLKHAQRTISTRAAFPFTSLYKTIPGTFLLFLFFCLVTQCIQYLLTPSPPPPSARRRDGNTAATPTRATAAAQEQQRNANMVTYGKLPLQGVLRAVETRGGSGSGSGGSGGGGGGNGGRGIGSGYSHGGAGGAPTPLVHGKKTRSSPRKAGVKATKVSRSPDVVTIDDSSGDEEEEEEEEGVGVAEGVGEGEEVGVGGEDRRKRVGLDWREEGTGGGDKHGRQDGRLSAEAAEAGDGAGDGGATVSD